MFPRAAGMRLCRPREVADRPPRTALPPCPSRRPGGVAVGDGSPRMATDRHAGGPPHGSVMWLSLPRAAVSRLGERTRYGRERQRGRPSSPLDTLGVWRCGIVSAMTVREVLRAVPGYRPLCANGLFTPTICDMGGSPPHVLCGCSQL